MRSKIVLVLRQLKMLKQFLIFCLFFFLAKCYCCWIFHRFFILIFTSRRKIELSNKYYFSMKKIQWLSLTYCFLIYIRECKLRVWIGVCIRVGSVFIDLYVCKCLCVYVRICKRACIGISVCICVYMYMSLHIDMCVWADVCISMCVHRCVYMNMAMCVYIRLFMHFCECANTRMYIRVSS